MSLKNLPVIFLTMLLISIAAARGKEGSNNSLNKPSLIGVLDTMEVNNIFLPFQNDGSTAEDAGAFFPNGTALSFLFQGGIAASGFVNGELRASWMAKASLIQEFQPGKWNMDPDDSRAKFYKVRSSDGPGSQAYINWAGAVALGAEFQDVDGDGLYDPDIDRPDTFGDRTSWCVYNDGTDITVRNQGLQTDPLGMEVHQQVWAMARSDQLGNVVFFRYRMINVSGSDIDDLIFSIWADPDIGAAEDDLIGSDTTLSLGYIYNNGDDPNYGANPPAFGIDFFQGPVVESPGDTAFVFRGPWFGIDTIPGMKNLPMTSFVFYNNANDPDPFPSPRENVQRARNYQQGGFDGQGNPIDPTLFGVGGLSTDPPQFFYPGEPEQGTGWIDITEADKRFLVNTGPFQLAVGDTQDIVVAYVVGQGNSPTNSVTQLKDVDVVAQKAYDANFFVAGPPPPPVVHTRTFDKKIEFIIDLDENGTFSYNQSDKMLNRQVFEGIKVYQMRSSSINEEENGLVNRKLIASLDITNQYSSIFERFGNEIIQIYQGTNSINAQAIQANGEAVLSFIVDKDAFNQDGPLVNNVEYFFSITAFSINVPFLENLEGGAWIGNSGILLENNLGGGQLHRAIPGLDENSPFMVDTAEYVGPRTNHDGKVIIDVVDRDALTGDDYLISFFDNGSYYQITNTSIDSVVKDSLVFQDTLNGSAWTFPVVEGLSIKIKDVPEGLNSAVVDSGDSGNKVWLTGSGRYPDSSRTLNGGIVLADDPASAISNHTSKVIFDKTGYFPVKVVFDTQDNSVAQHYTANWFLSFGMKPTFVTAFDNSNPNDPRQLYVAYLGGPNSAIDFTAGSYFVVFTADFQDTVRYDRLAFDSLFQAEAYMIFELRLADSTSVLQENVLEILATPNFPNSDLDQYKITGGNLLPVLSLNSKQDLLENVGVVPNPYWAYSRYETSYDTPVMKFIHLDQRATIRIFSLAGHLVKTINKDDELSEISWNLRNEAGLKVASGMYIAHIEVPGVGSKILKIAIVQREERLDRF